MERDNTDIDWQFCQVFGEPKFDEVSEVDIVSAIEFDATGEYLAAGDRGGRVVIFQRVESADTPCEYKFHAEFQSHEPEFDYLKSLEIEEKINQIKWCPSHNQSLFVLTTNDKTIKLWKIYDKLVPIEEEENEKTTKSAGLKLPQSKRRERIKTAVPRKIFANAHAYHINSISLNSDGQTYISADDLRINLWNLEMSDQSFNIVDIKPANMEELTEVITTAEFHPTSCNYLMYSSSKGTIKLGDLRSAALCDNHAKRFEEEEDPANRSFFSEIIASISDVKFSKDGNHILARDYLSLKLWDIRKEDKPVRTIRIHDYLKSKLCDLYENDCIFDKFECSTNKTGDHLLTGSYNNYFQVYDIRGEKTKPLRIKLGRGPTRKSDVQLNADDIDYNKKVLHAAWHPQDDIIAVAANNNLYLYAGKK
eukprot:TRINITY_DN2315_c0_g1_i1.p1 TRINITY_DN2315_c0_g1~~TRINITY_DN2315_c0_g1_i1.p1  ORF type:complete len:422 (-),score=72.97 TRINITY_DN2315_c0_g1_i1:87-1352(-)